MIKKKARLCGLIAVAVLCLGGCKRQQEAEQVPEEKGTGKTQALTPAAVANPAEESDEILSSILGIGDKSQEDANGEAEGEDPAYIAPRAHKYLYSESDVKRMLEESKSSLEPFIASFYFNASDYSTGYLESLWAYLDEDYYKAFREATLEQDNLYGEGAEVARGEHGYIVPPGEYVYLYSGHEYPTAIMERSRYVALYGEPEEYEAFAIDKESEMDLPIAEEEYDFKFTFSDVTGNGFKIHVERTKIQASYGFEVYIEDGLIAEIREVEGGGVYGG